MDVIQPIGRHDRGERIVGQTVIFFSGFVEHCTHRAASMPRFFAAVATRARCSSIRCGPIRIGVPRFRIGRWLRIWGLSLISRNGSNIRRDPFAQLGDILRGPNRPTNPSKLRAGNPASATVGTLGKIETCSRFISATILILPVASL